MGCGKNANKVKNTKEPTKLDCTPLVISGPSGVGKGTLIKMLTDGHKNRFASSISYTTRQMRPGEAEGVNYYYVTVEVFEKMKADNKFVECVVYNGNQYGTAHSEIERLTKLNKVCIMEIDVEGAMKIKETKMSANYLFIKPKSADILKDRLKGRGTETEEVIKQRVEIALKELSQADTCGVYNHFLVNDELKESYANMEKLLKDIYKVI